MVATERIRLLGSVLIAAGLAVQGGAAQTAPDRSAPAFDTDVLPLLRGNCIGCHGESVRQRGLDLRSHAGVVRGGESGTAIIAGDPARSILYQKISAGAMPPGNKKLTPGQIDLIRRWIESGGNPGSNAAPSTTQAAASAITDREILVNILHV